jgi:crossover junction endodeoxyribonuclease RusA
VAPVPAPVVLPSCAVLARDPAWLVDIHGRRWRVLVDFWVPGYPSTQGSHHIETRPVKGGARRATVVPDHEKDLGRWRDAVESAAFKTVGQRWKAAPLQGPVLAVLDFVLPRNKTDPKTWTPAAVSQKDGDGDKLDRATWDAVTKGGVWHDDSVVTTWAGDKRRAELGEHPGARIRVGIPDPVVGP